MASTYPTSQGPIDIFNQSYSEDQGWPVGIFHLTGLSCTGWPVDVFRHPEL